MTKEVFLKSLDSRLRRLPPEELHRQISYYEELLDDMIEDGIEEEQAVARLGEIDDIVDEILKDIPMQALVKNRVKPKNGWSAAAIAILIITAPIWLSLLLAAVCLAAALIISVFTIVLSMFAVLLALGLAGIGSVIHGFTLFSLGPGAAVFAIGAGLILLGLVCLGLIAAQYGAAGLFRAVRWIYRSIKSAAAKEGK